MPEQDHSEALQALDQIQGILGDQEETRGFPSRDEICTQYKSIRPLAQKALDLVGFIPVYGVKIALAMKFLMQVADLACPAAKDS